MLLRSRHNKHRYIQFLKGRIVSLLTDKKDRPGLISNLGNTCLCRLSKAAVAVAGLALFLLPLGCAELPSGYTSVAGSATFDNNGTVLNINASDKAIINYQSFNIGSGNTVNIFSPLSLHRVMGGSPSQIFGSLNSTGKVFLVNQSGIFFGNNAKVNVQGLLASTLDIKNEDFLSGNYVFQRDANLPAGSIINHGQLTGQESIALLGGAIENSGMITAPRIALAVGDQVSYTLGPELTVDVTVDQSLKQKVEGYQNAILNTGTLQGNQVELQAKLAQSFYENTINNTGLIKATGFAQDATGKIVAVGQAETGDAVVRNTGTMDASGASGSPNGGMIHFEGGTAINNGSMLATGSNTGKGGTVHMFGNNILNYTNSLIDVSGGLGGGTALLGGDYQGKNPLIRNALFNFQDSGARIFANAGNQGNGGKVILWADGTTLFKGLIEAKGGSLSGNGGFVGTSGHNILQAFGLVNASASNGNAGQWLLDPNNITIQNAGLDSNILCVGGVCSTTNNSAVVTTGTINASLNGGTDITIQTDTAGGNSEDGYILVNAGTSISKTAGGDATLTLKSHQGIYFDGNGGSSISVNSTSGKLNLVLHTDTDQTGNGPILMNYTNINSNGGNITFGGGANPFLSPAPGMSGYSTGIMLDHSSLSAGAGNILLRGKGLDNGGGADQLGIGLYNGSQLSTSSGNITLSGTGGVSSISTYGIFLYGTGTSITTNTGQISLTGTGGTSTSGVSIGVLADTNASINSTGSGGITVSGTAGAGSGGGNNVGVWIGNNSSINSQNGNISVTGAGASNGAGGGNSGIIVETGADINSTGTATISMSGTGATGTDRNYGISLNDGSINSATGNISLTGQGGNGSADLNKGISAQNNSTIASSGTATITLSGTGGNGTAENDGVYIKDSVVTSANGNVSLTGQGGNGSGSYNRGVVLSGGSVQSTGSATLDLNGTGGVGTAFGYGVEIYGSDVTSQTGNIHILGQGSVTNNQNHGVGIENSSLVRSTGGANILIEGVKGAGAGSYGITTDWGSNILGGNTMTGNLTLATDVPSLLNVQMRTTGQLNLKPYTSSASIGINGGGGTLQLTNSILNLIDTSTVAPSRVILGDAVSGTGTVTIANGWNISGYNFPIDVYGGSITTGGITLNGKNLTLNALSTDIAITSNSTFSKSIGSDSLFGMYAVGSILANTGGTLNISSSSNKLNLVLNSDTDATNGGAIYLNNATINSNNGNITLGGGGNPLTTAAVGTAAGGNTRGISLDSSSLSSGTGNISLRGTGATNVGSGQYGINLTLSQLASTTGNITLNGTGGVSASSSNYGLYVDRSQVTSSGTGAITINATGGAGTSNNYGAFITGGTSLIQVNNGNLSLTATGGTGTGNFNDGLVLGSAGAAARIESVGNGTLNISGYGGGTGAASNNFGVIVEAGTITSQTGNISVLGQGGLVSGSNNEGIILDSGASITSTGNADVTLTGIKGVGASNGIRVTPGTANVMGGNAMAGDLTFITDVISMDAGNAVIRTAGDLTFKPYTPSTNIGINGGGGTLQISNALLGKIDTSTVSPSSLTIGDSAAGSGLVLLNNGWNVSNYNFPVNVYGGDITMEGIIQGGNNVTLNARTGNITVNAGSTFSKTTGGDSLLRFNAAHSIIFDGTAGNAISLSSSSNKLNVTLNADTDQATDTTVGGAISLAYTNINSNGGNITLGGGANPATTAARGTGVNRNGISFSGSSLTTGGGNISLRGNGYAFLGGLNDLHGISLTNGSQLSTTSGAISLNGTGGPSAQSNYGIYLKDAGTLVTTQTGSIAITGQGGNGTGSTNHGVMVDNGAQVTSTGSGTVAVTGTAGTGTSDNYGVRVNGANSLITSSGGNLTVTGTGGGFAGTSYNFGVDVDGGGKITGTGNAALSINGTGGNGDSRNWGVSVRNNNSAISVANGNLSITGQGGNATGSDNYGVRIDSNATVTSTGSGNTAVTGTGGAGTTHNFGVDVDGGGQITNAGSGTLTVNGTGGTGTNNHWGVVVRNANSVISTVNGNATITGQGGNATGNDNYGVRVESTGKITGTGSGTLTITGTGRGTGSHNFGVDVDNGGEITITNNAPLTMSGTGGNGTNNNYGISVRGANSVISAKNGTASITGQGGNGSGASNNGINLDSSDGIEATGTGNVTISGTGGTGTGSSHGVSLFQSAITGAGSGNLSITGIKGAGTSNGIDVAGAGNIFGGNGMSGNLSLITDVLSLGTQQIRTSGILTLKPYTSSTSIGINGGSGTLNTGNFMASIDNGTVSPSRVIIGDSAAGSGSVTIGNGWNLAAGNSPVEVYGGSITTGSITAGNHSLLLRGRTGNITLNGGATLTSNAAGDALVLAPAQHFINNAGASALSTPSGRWLVYSSTPGNTVTGGLAHTALYNRTYLANPPASIVETGNLLLYASADAISTSTNSSTSTSTLISLLTGTNLPYLLNSIQSPNTVTPQQFFKKESEYQFLNLDSTQRSNENMEIFIPDSK